MFERMATILPVNEFSPSFGSDCFLAPNCTVVGNVVLGDKCSIWFNAVVRGDVNFIRAGDRVNIQDGAVIHGTYKTAGTTIGNDVSVGHNAVIHGCTLEDRVLVGMGAIVMDKAIVKSNTIVAAGAVVLQNSELEENSIYAGVPARKVRDIDAETAKVFLRTSNNYIMYSKWFDNDGSKLL